MLSRTAVTRPPEGAEGLLATMAATRERTLGLVASISDADLERVHDPLMSPLVWDLGHIAAFEDLWVSGRGTGMAPLRPAFFIQGTYQGREATILVTTSAGQPGRVDLWVFPRDSCTSPILATARVR